VKIEAFARVLFDPRVVEDATDIILNLKQVPIKLNTICRDDLPER